MIHPEIEFRSLIAEADGRTYRGHEGVREWWYEVPESIGGLRYERETMEALGADRGIIKLRIVGTLQGVEVAQTLWQVWRVRDGLLCWWDAFRTEAEAREALALTE